MTDIHVHAPWFIAAGSILPPVCSSVVALRFYARRINNAALKADDWLTIPALLLVLGMCIAVLIGVAWRVVGYDSPPLPPGQTILTVQDPMQTQLRKIFWSIELMQDLALMVIKLSFLLFYRRIFHKGSSWWKKLILDGLIVFTILWGVAYFIAFLLLCPGKPDAWWSSLETLQQYCIRTVPFHNSFMTIDFVLDVIIFTYPIVLMWNIQLSIKKKIGLMCIFLLGAFTIFTSCIRMVTYYQSTRIEFQEGTDTAIIDSTVMYWCVLECGLALIACCLPTCSSLVRHANDNSTEKSNRMSLSKWPSSQRFSRYGSGAWSGPRRFWHESSFGELPKDSTIGRGSILVTRTYDLRAFDEPAAPA